VGFTSTRGKKKDDTEKGCSVDPLAQRLKKKAAPEGGKLAVLKKKGIL